MSHQFIKVKMTKHQNPKLCCRSSSAHCGSHPQRRPPAIRRNSLNHKKKKKKKETLNTLHNASLLMQSLIRAVPTPSMRHQLLAPPLQVSSSAAHSWRLPAGFAGICLAASLSPNCSVGDKHISFLFKIKPAPGAAAASAQRRFVVSSHLCALRSANILSCPADVTPDQHPLLLKLSQT
jgi:hypothetical protein